MVEKRSWCQICKFHKFKGFQPIITCYELAIRKKLILEYLGKPSATKSAVFFNIVQKAFDPPPLLNNVKKTAHLEDEGIPKYDDNQCGMICGTSRDEADL